MTNCTITRNEQFNSYELNFDGKPSENVRALLKANGYRWHGMRGIWYGYKDIAALLDGATVEQSTTDNAPKQAQKTTKAKTPESRLTYTAHGIKGKNGEIIDKTNKSDYIATWYDFDPVRLEIRLTMKDYKHLYIIPRGCTCKDDSDIMTDYFDNEELIIPATAGAEFLAAATGYKKHVETMRKKGEKSEYYRGETELADRHADALKLAEQIASGETPNGAQLIAERITADKERKESEALERNKQYAAQLLKDGNRNGATVEQTGDIVIYREAQRVQIFDGLPNCGRVETLETVIAINIKTGKREQVQHATHEEASAFYKRVAA